MCLFISLSRRNRHAHMHVHTQPLTLSFFSLKKKKGPPQADRVEGKKKWPCAGSIHVIHVQHQLETAFPPNRGVKHAACVHLPLAAIKAGESCLSIDYSLGSPPSSNQITPLPCPSLSPPSFFIVWRSFMVHLFIEALQ